MNSLKNQTVNPDEINVDEDSKYIENLLQEPIENLEETKENPQKEWKIKPAHKLNMKEFYEKDIDELLDDSNWDLNSLDSESFQHSLAESDWKVRGLESIYLQRLHAGIGNKPKKSKARFRHL